MRLSHLTFLLSLSFAPATHSFAADAHSNISTPDLVPWTLPFYVKEALSQDAHLEFSRISPDNARIALLGSSVWVWEPESSSLKRFSLAQDAAAKNLLGVEWLEPEKLLLVDTEGFSVLTLPSGKIIKNFRFKSKTKSSLLGYNITPSHLHFFTGQKLVSFTRDLSTHRTVNLAPASLPRAAHVALTQNGSEIWWTLDKSLYRLDLAAKRREKSLVYKSEEPILNLSAHESFVAITSSKATHLFNNAGKLQQAIPVKSQRRIVAATTEKAIHAYLFQDGLLETFRLPEGNKRTAHLAIEDLSSHVDLQASADKLIVIHKGNLQMWGWQNTALPIAAKQDDKKAVSKQ